MYQFPVAGEYERQDGRVFLMGMPATYPSFLEAVGLGLAFYSGFAPGWHDPHFHLSCLNVKWFLSTKDTSELG